MYQKKHCASRIAAMLLSLVMLVGMVPGAAFAAEAPDYKFGTAQTVLTPGKYDLPVSMMKDNNHEKPSMAGSAIRGGELEVREDGSAVVALALGPVSMMGITAWAKDWEVFNEYNTTSAVTPAEVVGRDEKEHVTAVRFQLPYTDQDGVYIQMMAMGSSPSQAFLKLDFARASTVRTGAAEVAFGSEKAYDVTAEVTVMGGQTITGVKLSDNAAQSGHENSAPYAKKAAAMADKFNNLSATDAAAIQGVDVVAGATITSKAYQEAVLKALDLHEASKPADFGFGSANTRLAPGQYKLPVALMNSGSHEKPSMAGSAFAPAGLLTVSEEGVATLTLDMQAVTIGMPPVQITDMAHTVLVYQADNCDKGTATVPAQVLKTAVKPEPMPGAGKEVPTQISFILPDNSWDGVYLNFTVDAMGPGTPDGWLKLDFAAAAVPGTVTTQTGSAKVDQFGKYTIDASVSVKDGVISGVDVSARDFISSTHKETNDMKIAQVTEALKSAWNGIAPTQDNAEEIFYKIMKPEDHDAVIDAVAGATYSAKAVRDAVMDAFDLEYQDEVINVPETVEPGVYQVEIGYYSDVVYHSLVENAKTMATLTVNADGTMTLDFETRSGTDKEPLYILGFNGVYENNDRSGNLTMEGCETVMGLSANDYEDQFFAKGTQVVNHLTIPLLGGLNKVYNTNCRIYVPAMNKLNGELSGVMFENGTFNADVFAKIYWDGMKKVGQVPQPQPQQPVLAEGSYTVPVAGLVSGAPLQPVKDAFAQAFGQEIRIDVDADGRMTATINPQHMVVDMAAMGAYHCNVLTVEGASYPEMKTELVSPAFGKPEVTQEIQCPAVVVVPMPQADEQGGYPFSVTVDFMNAFLGGGLEKDHPTEVTLTLDFDNARKIEETQKIEDGNYYVPVYLWHASKDQASMGDMAMENNRRVLVTVKDGRVTEVQAATGPVNMAGFVSGVTAMTVNGEAVTVQKTGKMTTQLGNEYDYLKNFKFAMPEGGQPDGLEGVTYVPVAFVVPDTPMGADPIQARMKFDWAAAEMTQDTELEANGDVNTDNEPVELVDEATGIRLNSNSLVVPTVAQLTVDQITSGASYEAAVQAMGSQKGWKLYHIVTVVKGEESAPNGQVTLSIPCGPDGLQVYRINEDGTRVTIRGQVRNGCYVFNTSKLGDFAIVGQIGISFRDLPESHWGHDFVIRSVELNLFSGYPDGNFGPDDPMTRGMFVTVLGKLAGVDVTTAEKSRFSDVDPNAFYAPYVAWAEKAGITAGVGNNRFDPDGRVTREQMAIFLVHYCEYADVELKEGRDLVFNDEDQISGYAADFVAAAVRGGLMAGVSGNNFAPQETANRAQAATVLVKLVEAYGL